MTSDDALKQQAANEALAKSGLDTSKLTAAQRAQIIGTIQQQLGGSSPGGGPPGAVSFFSINVGCIACKAGLNVVAAVPIGLIIAAGVAVGPETAAVVTIADFFGGAAVAARIATIINTAMAAAGGASVEDIIASLCEGFGAC